MRRSRRSGSVHGAAAALVARLRHTARTLPAAVGRRLWRTLSELAAAGRAGEAARRARPAGRLELGLTQLFGAEQRTESRAAGRATAARLETYTAAS